MSLRVDRARVLAFRARANHLDRRVSSFPDAACGGLQDSAPRSGVISLHARANNVEPGSWEHPSLAQIWFRGGTDYVISRADVGVFTLGSLPRDPARRKALEDIADAAHAVMQGRTLKVREVSDALGLEFPFMLRAAATTGRLLIRWNASMIWLIPSERPDVDPEEARVELARRFLRWFGPQTKDRLAWWTGADRRDATATWTALRDELVDVEADEEMGTARAMLATDVEALEGAEPVEGVRLLPIDDPYLKADRRLLVPDGALHDRLFPPRSLGYLPGGVLVDGELAGVWQRQQRKVTIHPWRTFDADTKEAVEREALTLPVAAKSEAEVRWD